MLPAGQKIQFHVTSLDVTHSFNFFALGVKADAVPLNDNVVSATPTEIGTYRVQCTDSAVFGTETCPTAPQWS